MKVLELNLNFLIWLGVCSTSNSNRFLFKTNYILVLLLQILGLLSSIWFIAEFIGKDLNSVLYAGFHTSAYSTSTYSLLVGYVFQHKIVTTFEKLQFIYDNCNYVCLDFDFLQTISIIQSQNIKLFIQFFRTIIINFNFLINFTQ